MFTVCNNSLITQSVTITSHLTNDVQDRLRCGWIIDITNERQTCLVYGCYVYGTYTSTSQVVSRLKERSYGTQQTYQVSNHIEVP